MEEDIMQTKEVRLRRIQQLAHEMNRGNEPRQFETLNLAVDNLSRALGDLADPSGNYSLDYIEEKLGKAHYLLFKNEKKIKLHS